MSNFICETRHPITGKVYFAEWLDDHFGRHLYGVRFPDGSVFDGDRCERVDIEDILEES